ncbi:FIG00484051: hypothetical protein [hydrothermal vent metagenome]|uniref:ATP-dependent Zn proteases n=1 Tax=hydrothermal vent metagenome TaxID=652676 RepID=A0A3B0S4H0_9ZZZZ
MNLLRSDITVQALIRRATSNGAFAVVRKHGDDDAGSVLVMVSTMDGLATLYGPTRDENFNRVWERLCPPASPEVEIEKTLAKRLQFDPDIWVIEIEDRQGRHFLAETVMD